MDNEDFDAAVVAAVFQQAGLVGWRDATLADSCRAAGIADLAHVRRRFPGKSAVLLKFGRLADQAALAALAATGTPRERIFDLVMSRFDYLQSHRAGVLALMTALRTDPASLALIHAANLRSMAWMLDAAEIPATGLVGLLRVHGLAAVWAYTLRAWEQDESADMSATMAALDRALDRAIQAENMLPGHRAVPSPAPDPVAPPPTPHAPPPMISGPEIAGMPDGPAVI